MSFTRRIEDFICDHCKIHVHGTGYTNHCPKCLWSKHVDVGPGDRKEACQGMMEPVSVEGTVREYVLVHVCTKCGVRRRNKVAPADDMNAVIALSEKHAAK
ncbi:RNHCP domain-containing protein [Candidatus Kaiserbacteria bacterium]|nr:RNHCP domain-containing protein [Candidatus Kaiserbacteria bacterium]